MTGVGTPYECGTATRRAAVAAAPGQPLNGIDHLEVEPDRRTLRVRFVHPLPGEAGGVPAGAAPLTTANVVVEGGVRVRDPDVEGISAAGHELTVVVARPGDHSPYRLRLVAGPGHDQPPAGFDVPLADVRFSFVADCPSDLDCGPDSACPAPPPAPPPTIDYLARDYGSLRRLLLDRLAAVAPDWRERNPANLGVAVVELLAAVGDQLSYAQDAASTEAYLGTARRRSSVRRHARLLDYRLDDGGNARTWVVITTDAGGDGFALPGPDPATGRAGTAFLTRTTSGAGVLTGPALTAALAEGPEVFEALHGIELRTAFNEIAIHTWGEERCCLPTGSTRAVLRDDGGRLSDPDTGLRRGALLLFEEVRGPDTGLPGDADPAHRNIVRLTGVRPDVDPLAAGEQRIVEVTWGVDDALPFPVCADLVAAPGEPGRHPVTVVRGNVLLADHGRTRSERLDPAAELHRPRLAGPLVHRRRARDDAGREVAVDPTAPAAFALQPSAEAPALPALTLHRPGRHADRLVEVWLPRLDLLGSDRFARELVVETEDDGAVSLRFSDEPSGALQITYRTGGGRAGNIGADALVAAAAAADTGPLPAGLSVRNPLPGVGGRDPEPTEQARLLAPQAFRRQERAVTEADYAEVAQRHPEVARAIATRRHTGSWHTMFVTVDRRGGLPVDPPFEARLRRFLETYRLMAHDIEIEGPRFVPLDVAMTVCVAPGHLRGSVLRALQERFGTGPGGLFDPDTLTFAQPVFLSSLVAAAMGVPGVRWVDFGDAQRHRFQRYGRAPAGELAAGRIDLGRLEIARLDNDPNAPEQGRLVLHLEGGL